MQTIKQDFQQRKQYQHSKKNSRPEEDNLIYGKLPPQALDIERSVLGALLMEHRLYADVSELITKPEIFYTQAHQDIFRAIQRLNAEGSMTDFLTVTEMMTRMGTFESAGGHAYLVDLMSSVVSSARIIIHSAIVLDRFLRRELIRISSETSAQAYDTSDDVFDTIDECEHKLSVLLTDNTTSNYRSAPEIAKDSLNAITENGLRKEDLVGLDTGVERLNYLLQGWQPNLIILAARPSIGKTAAALQFAMNVAKNGHGVGFFSIEMSERDLMYRVIAQMSGLDMGVVKSGKFTPDEQAKVIEAHQRFSNLNFHIDEARVNMQQLKSKARRMVHKNKIKMLFVDYLGQMKVTGDDAKKIREQQIASIINECKELVKELRVPLCLLCQLNRDVEKDKSKNGEPSLVDLRESGEIEQGADVVAFLYGQKAGEKDEHGQIVQAEHLIRHLKIAKNRNGNLATIDLHFNATTQQITEINPDSNYRPANAGLKPQQFISSQDKKDFWEEQTPF